MKPPSHSKRARPFRLPRWTGGVAVLLVIGLGACFSSAPSSSETRPTILDPRWQASAFAERIDFLRDLLQEEDARTSPAVADYVSASMKEARLQPALEGRYRLAQAAGGATGYVGYVGGKNPPVAREAVLVCAALAAPAEAPRAAVREETVPEAVALLETARVYGRSAQYTLMPERSVIFALWPRTANDDPLAGLRAYLRQPTWRLDQVRAVLYVGLPERLRAEARALLAEYDLPLYRVETASENALRETAQATEEPAGDEAVQRAMRLAARTHERLRATTLTSGRMMPALGDTLRVPRGEQP